MFEEFKNAMTRDFEMTDIGLMAYYLGIEVKQNEEGIFISQRNYALEILKKFKTENCKPISTPSELGVMLSKNEGGEKVDPTCFKSLVGSLRYLTCTRLGILYAVGLVSRYMESPITIHFQVAKRILRYLKVWLRILLKEISLIQEEPTNICVDNKSAIALAKNPVFHDRSKHIDTRYHYICECVARKDVQLEFVRSQDQIADIFTKPLKFEDFARLRNLLGLVKQV